MDSNLKIKMLKINIRKRKVNKKCIQNISLLLIALVIMFFQIKKTYKFSKNENPNETAYVISDYDVLLDYFPVYKDSIYNIYIATISNIPKIIFLKKKKINSRQKESKFFVHIYPKNDSLLTANQSFIGFDFKNNTKEYNLRGKKVYISELALPKINIKKINTGQYGFRGDLEISWIVEKILTSEEIRKNLYANNEKGIYFFEL